MLLLSAFNRRKSLLIVPGKFGDGSPGYLRVIKADVWNPNTIILQMNMFNVRMFLRIPTKCWIVPFYHYSSVYGYVLTLFILNKQKKYRVIVLICKSTLISLYY